MPYAGGRALKTPFGTFYGPNITPHPQAGIGTLERGRISSARCAKAGGPTGRTTFRRFPIRRSRGSPTPTCATCGPTCASLPPSSAREPGARARLPVPLALAGRRLEVALLHARARSSPDPEAQRRAEPRRLPGQCARPLRRMPYAAQFPGRAEARPPPRRRRAGPEGKACPTSRPARLKKWSDARAAGFPADRHDPRRRRRLRDHGRGGDATPPASSRPQDLAALIAYLRSLPPLPDEPKN